LGEGCLLLRGKEEKEGDGKGKGRKGWGGREGKRRDGRGKEGWKGRGERAHYNMYAFP